ncbi:hypothetical protein SEA_ATUIN_216 [Arthrobacter phage Atuin]|nr:hypothetical protein SEA_ATUIN_15 [Arthrobacter phage Atuin]
MGETIETPGMQRWQSGRCRYFLKRIGTKDEVQKHHTFVLGLEAYMDRMERYEFLTSIEFDNSEAVDLMDRIAKFNGMPSYTAQLQRWALIEDILDREDGNKAHSKQFVIDKIREILKVTGKK